MGTNIQGHLEVKEKDRWKSLGTIPFWRSYKTYCLFAGVRCYKRQINPIAPPRGFPHDAETTATLMDYEKYKKQGYGTVSWLSYYDFLSYGMSRVRKIVSTHWKWFLGYMDEIARDVGAENVRIVFWFDNIGEGDVKT